MDLSDGPPGEGLNNTHPDDCQLCRSGEGQRHNYEPPEDTMSESTTTITMSPTSALFYKGVTAASEVAKQMTGPEWGDDFDLKLNAFWFYVGAAAGEEDTLDLNNGEHLQLFMQGAATRVPREPRYRYVRTTSRPLAEVRYWSEDGDWTDDIDEALEVDHRKRHEALTRGNGHWVLVKDDED